LTDNRAYLQGHLDRDVNHFAYPYGHSAACGPREARLVLESGFRTAVTTSHRPLVTRDGLNLHTLPRINIHPQTTVAHLDVDISGLTRATARNFLSTACAMLKIAPLVYGVKKPSATTSAHG
jgi:hypothetical protein